MQLPEKLRGRLIFVALAHGVNTRGLSSMEIVARIKKKHNVAKEDEKILREVCNFYEVDYGRLPGVGV